MSQDLSGVKLHLIENADEVAAFQRWLGERRPVLAIDSETSGLNWWAPTFRCRLVQFGDANHGWAMSFLDWRGLVVDTLKNYTGPIVGHNFSYDAHVLTGADKRISIPWGRVHDTLLMSSIVEPRGLHGLKALAGRYFGPEAREGEARLKATMAARGWEWSTVPTDLPDYFAYGALDAVLTARLWEIFDKRIPELGLTSTHDLERAVQPILFNMEAKGFAIDAPLALETQADCDAQADVLRAQIKERYGVSVGSPKQIADLLVRAGVPLEKRTASGALAVDEDVLLEVALLGPDFHALAHDVLAYRRVTKISGSYLRNALERLDSDGRLHASIRQLGAKTGRMSVAQPSLQNLPRGQEVRDCFVPSEGNVLLSADYDQIEVRLTAHFSRDPAMVAAIESGDFHTMTARYVYQDDTIDKHDERRSWTKNGVFARIYGAQAKRLAATLGIPLERAQEVMDGLGAAYPGVDDLMRRVISKGHERKATEGSGYVRTPLGRRGVAADDKVFALTNYLIQGSAADVLKQALVRLDAAGLGDMMVLPVHDEVLFDIPEADVADARPLIEATMLDTAWLVPLTAECSEGLHRWGDKYHKTTQPAYVLTPEDD